MHAEIGLGVPGVHTWSGSMLVISVWVVYNTAASVTVLVSTGQWAAALLLISFNLNQRLILSIHFPALLVVINGVNYAMAGCAECHSAPTAVRSSTALHAGEAGDESSARTTGRSQSQEGGTDASAAQEER